MNLLILGVDDEPDVELLFRRDLGAGRFSMEFARSADMALARINEAADDILILFVSDINTGNERRELLPKVKFMRPEFRSS